MSKFPTIPDVMALPDLIQPSTGVYAVPPASWHKPPYRGSFEMMNRIANLTRTDQPFEHDLNFMRVTDEIDEIVRGWQHKHAIYMAHSITTNPTREPNYYPDLSEQLAVHEITGFRPALYFNGDGHPCRNDPKLLVFSDLHIIGHCGMLVIDLTHGLSFGGTVEATYAKLIGLRVGYIHYEEQAVSAWAKGIADFHITLPQHSHSSVAAVAEQLFKEYTRVL